MTAPSATQAAKTAGKLPPSAIVRGREHCLSLTLLLILATITQCDENNVPVRGRLRTDPFQAGSVVGLMSRRRKFGLPRGYGRDPFRKRLKPTASYSRCSSGEAVVGVVCASVGWVRRPRAMPQHMAKTVKTLARYRNPAVPLSRPTLCAGGM